MSTTSTIVQRLWNYCNVLRDDGVSYGDYVEQLTYLLFLKMAHEQVEELDEARLIPEKYDWASLCSLEGDDLEKHYRATLLTLGKGTGLIPTIFRKAQNKISDPAKLRRLIRLIDEETWIGLGLDVKGAIYEGLLEKNAQDTKSGAGQYFTPRPLIQAMVEVMAPQPGQTICDPACGTGGFLLGAHDYIQKHHRPLNRDQHRHLQREALHGSEIVANTARLCVMNLYLHNIGDPKAYTLEEGTTQKDVEEEETATPQDAEQEETSTQKDAEQDVTTGSGSPIHVADSLLADSGERFDLVLSNPPFGKKSSVTILSDDGQATRQTQTIVRDDFSATTSNKQLNFVQHIKTILKVHGKAAVVVPDNVLFEGGAGETVRRDLLTECDVHTLLRLPTGIFYAQGVKANVLFFDKKPAHPEPWTKSLCIYDLRTNKRFTLKRNPLTRADLDEFVACYRDRDNNPAMWSEDNSDGRWRCYSYEELMARDKVNLDIFWLRDESLEDTANLPSPYELAAEIVEDLRVALALFEDIDEQLASEE